MGKIEASKPGQNEVLEHGKKSVAKMSIIKNPGRLECAWCFNDEKFTLFGIQKIYPKVLEDRAHPNLNWQVLIHCDACMIGTNYLFTDFRWRRTISEHVKKMIISQKMGRKPERRKL
jgi:hypothetical protein